MCEFLATRRPAWCASRQPLLRLPNLAIHMNREVNESGLKFNKQTELPLLLGLSEDDTKAEATFPPAASPNCSASNRTSADWEFNAYDTQKGAFWGATANSSPTASSTTWPPAMPR
jgi:aspartyl aminopeptidase